MHKVDGTQISRTRKNILYTILRVTSFMFSEWCGYDSKITQSRLRYEIEFHLCYKLQIKNLENPKIGVFRFFLNLKTYVFSNQF